MQEQATRNTRGVTAVQPKKKTRIITSDDKDDGAAKAEGDVGDCGMLYVKAADGYDEKATEHRQSRLKVE